MDRKVEKWANDKAAQMSGKGANSTVKKVMYIKK